MTFLWFLAFAATVAGQGCPGYIASNVQRSNNGLTADLSLAGSPCNTYGIDLQNLTLRVEYQTDSRLHVIIQDTNQTVYQVPESVVPRPNASSGVSASESQLQFSYVENPFSFAVSRPNGESLFNTSGSPLIFQPQYLGLRTSLPYDPNLYGLGEHSDHFRLNTSNYTRTLWSRDAYGIPPGTNLYGNHPIYFDHRGENGTHGVLLLNSNGMDIKVNNTEGKGQYLEYNTLGGVFDFYFVAGPTPLHVSSQYAGIVGLPVMMPYWGFGFHQCRYGYRDVYQVAEVVYNYSQAGIPLETMWTDIDYMDHRLVFTLSDHFPLEKMRELIDHLHADQQHYIVMVDPAVAYANYSAFNQGAQLGIFLKTSNGSTYEGVVWPGPTAFPDWFDPQTQQYWNAQFDTFFNADTGLDIDALWIDMNEASNFCYYPCTDPVGFAGDNSFPPSTPPLRQYSPRPLPGFPPDFQPANASSSRIERRSSTPGSMMGLPSRDYINPPYMIQNAAGGLPNRTLDTDLVHYNGLVEYDTHNMYGTMMSSASREAMLSRRPTVRPMIITRSTYLGAGTQVGHWLGDNLSLWDKYRISISGMLQFASLYQIPMVGSDVCGFGGNTTETLCERWAMLGAFYPFYRNHNSDTSIPQEFYLWPSVTSSAKYAIDIRYKMLDYIYTALHTQTVLGVPLINPLWFIYPNDTNTFGIDLQFFYGDAVLVSPVTEENVTSVDIYLPNDMFYDYNNNFAPVRGNGTNVTLHDVGFQTIPLHIRGGTVLPLRSGNANTTTELRKRGFNLLIALGLNSSATGSLYLDEGNLIDQPSTTELTFSYANQTFSMNGIFAYDAGVNIDTITILGCSTSPSSVSIYGGGHANFRYNSSNHVAVIDANIALKGNMSMSITLAPVSSGSAAAVPHLDKIAFPGGYHVPYLAGLCGLVVGTMALRWL